MQDVQITDRIQALVDEEHQLRSTGEAAEEPDRLRHIERDLDRCWDLLRQRRARREFGEDPDEAQTRSGDTVEGYWQ